MWVLNAIPVDMHTEFLKCPSEVLVKNGQILDFHWSS